MTDSNIKRINDHINDNFYKDDTSKQRSLKNHAANFYTYLKKSPTATYEEYANGLGWQGTLAKPYKDNVLLTLSTLGLLPSTNAKVVRTENTVKAAPAEISEQEMQALLQKILEKQANKEPLIKIRHELSAREQQVYSAEPFKKMMMEVQKKKTANTANALSASQVRIKVVGEAPKPAVREVLQDLVALREEILDILIQQFKEEENDASSVASSNSIELVPQNNNASSTSSGEPDERAIEIITLLEDMGVKTGELDDYTTEGLEKRLAEELAKQSSVSAANQAAIAKVLAEENQGAPPSPRTAKLIADMQNPNFFTGGKRKTRKQKKGGKRRTTRKR